MYTVVRKSYKGNMLMLKKDGEEKPVWFFLTDEVQRFARNVKENAVITEIQTKPSDDGQSQVITRLALDKPATGENTNTAGASSYQGSGSSYNSYKKPYQKTETSNQYKTWGKTPEEQEQIARLSIMHDAARITASLNLPEAQLAIDTTTQIYKSLYEVFAGKKLTTEEIVA